MMYYLVIGAGMVLIVLFNMLFNTFSLTLGYVVLATVVMTVAVIAVGGLFAYIIRHLMPTRWFGIDSRWTAVSDKKLRFYERIGVRKWKDSVLELGVFSGFDKDKVPEKTDSAYFARFIMESNCGWVIHVVDIFVGALIVFIYPLQYWYMFALPVFVINAVLHYLPVCILRYNIPRLVRAYNLQLKLEERRRRKAEREVAVQSEVEVNNI